jgi:hypothetical protein
MQAMEPWKRARKDARRDGRPRLPDADCFRGARRGWTHAGRPIVAFVLVVASIGLVHVADVPPAAGALRSIIRETFDEVVPPSMPAGWTATRAVGQSSDDTWHTDRFLVSTSPYAATVTSADHATDMRLDSPVFVAGPNPRLTFQHRVNLDAGTSGNSARDAGVLEIKIGAASFVDFITAGGSWVQDGYSTIINSPDNNALNGREL